MRSKKRHSVQISSAIVNATNIKGEPGIRSANKDFEVLPLREVLPEVSPTGFRSLGSLDDSVGIHHELSSRQNVCNVVAGLMDVTLDIHGKTGCFGNSQAEVKSDAARNATDANKKTPHRIDCVEIGSLIVNKFVSVSGNDNIPDKGGT
jgi:hypothetical protein